MIRQRIRITGLVAVTLAVAAAAAPSAIAMPIGGTEGVTLPAPAPTSTAVLSNPDQQAPLAHTTPAIRANPDQQVPSSHATPTAATPTTGSVKEPGTSTGSSFDWVALGIGLGALGVLGLSVGVFRSATRRTRHPRRQRVAASS